jgi:hypothetical protein
MKEVLEFILGIIFVIIFFVCVILALPGAVLAHLFRVFFGETGLWIGGLLGTIFSYGLPAFAVPRVITFLLGREKIALMKKERLLVLIPWLFWIAVIVKLIWIEGQKKCEFNALFEPPFFGLLGSFILTQKLFYRHRSVRINYIIMIISIFIVSLLTIIITTAIGPIHNGF